MLLIFCFLGLVLIDAAALPKGVPHTIDKYRPVQSNQYRCYVSDELIDFSFVNDDFCDCLDGTDEPGTAACAGSPSVAAFWHAHGEEAAFSSTFYCPQKGSKPKVVPASEVNDGVCDCCDGSDEWQGLTPCKNTCWDEGALFRQRKQQIEQGIARRERFVKEGHTVLASVKAELEKEKATLPQHEATLKELEKEEDELKRLEAEKKAKERKKEEEGESQEQQQPLQSEEEALPPVSNVEPATQAEEPSPSPPTLPPAPASPPVQQDDDLDALDDDEVPTDCHEWGEDGKCHDKDHEHDEDEEGLIGEEDEMDEDEYYEEGEDREWEDSRRRAEGSPENATGALGWLRQWRVVRWLMSIGTKVKEQVKDTATRLTASKPRTELDKIRTKVSDTRHHVTEAKKKIDHLEKKAKDLESKPEYAHLYHKCVETNSDGYVYEVCFFKDAHQKKDHHSTNLGRRWKWDISTGNLDEDVMLLEGGQSCWNGPARSLKVRFVCGIEEKLQNVSEPSRCVYEVNMMSPAACRPHHLDEFKFLGDSSQQQHDEL
ncbi:unnamed protein product [Vitrella brassicaformis CCMP3155]|uniref:Glucosidase 2 subunit beta n=2 Tax=Vitrella brassicaformis TaxID=1169539 RepID=A0A0G4EL42_VITBC|nr:unnamed protein product [Vitrella brassicaformis CCMP3155]|mmetsp:Transcript_47685/g.119253  ORF Transcript_47685/g.119253 Transcript_47685/m.119253 type:complete len:544 (+) Transcript_47685:954-2585(+)|eukprot:CEL97111.1 unnamed protein product [Vitrella brassicaformis CCMP3155]